MRKLAAQLRRPVPHVLTYCLFRLRYDEQVFEAMLASWRGPAGLARRSWVERQYPIWMTFSHDSMKTPPNGLAATWEYWLIVRSLARVMYAL